MINAITERKGRMKPFDRQKVSILVPISAMKSMFIL